MNEGSGLVTELPNVSVVVPAYGAAETLLRCLKSLAKHLPANCAVSVVDDATPDDSVRRAYEDMLPFLPQLNYHRSEENRGFVSTCNFGCQHLRTPGTDLLLLNSDTRVTAGCLEEMQAVLYLHDRHGVVTPRSNNATAFSVPWSGGMLPAAESYRVWKRIRKLLPRYQVMPTAVGFCMIIKAEVLDRFELFDEIYSPGYNEENDFVCRINRCGYSAVAANQAYVFHCESSSFGSLRNDLEIAHHQILVDRYPEYDRKVASYYRFLVDPVELFAHLYAPHRRRIVFDLCDWPSERSVSSELALHLFREVSRLAEGDIEVYAGLRESQAFFASELAGHRIYYDGSNVEMSFDLVFRPSQIFTWEEFRRMNRLAPRVSYLSLGTINVRSDYLTSPERYILFRKAAELSDCVFATSEFAQTDFNAFYGSDLPMRVIHRDDNVDAASGAPEENVPCRWQNAAEQYVAAFREILAKDVDVTRLRARWDTIRLLESKQ
jgi:GT2 family glycosyltransferase